MSNVNRLLKHKIISFILIEIFIFSQSPIAGASPHYSTARIVRGVDTLPVIPEATDREVISIPERPLSEVLEELDIPVSIFDPEGSGFVTKVGRGAVTYESGHWEFALDSEELGYLEYRVGGQEYAMEIEKTDEGKNIRVNGPQGISSISILENGGVAIQLPNGQEFSYTDPENYALRNSNGRSIIDFNVNDGIASLKLSRAGQETLVKNKEVVEVGDEMVVRIRHDDLPEPQTFEQADDIEGFYFLDQITDFDGVILTPSGDTLLMYHDGGQLHSVIYRGREKFDQVRSASDPEGALDTLIAAGIPGQAKATVDASGDGRDRRGRWFNWISAGLAAIEAAIVAAGIADMGMVDMTIANYLIGGVMGGVLFRMYNRIARYGIKSFMSPFLNLENLRNQFPIDQEVMEDGLKIDQMIMYPIRKNIEDTLENARKILSDISPDRADDMTNGKLSVGIVSGGKGAINILAQLRGWKELTQKYGDRIRTYYFLMNKGQEVGFKYGALADAMKYIVDGTVYPENYLEYRDPNKPVFAGDQFIADLARGEGAALDKAVRDGILTQKEADELRQNPILTEEEAEQFVEHGILGDLEYLRSGNLRDAITIDAGDRYGEGQYLKMEARVVNASDEYDMFVPILQVNNPDETILTRFQARAQKLFTPIEYVNNWLFEGQPSSGKVRVKIESYVREIWDPEVLDVSVTTSHDHLESAGLKTAKLLDVQAFDSRQATMPKLEKQIMRFSYGDWLNWWREKLPNTHVGKFISKLFGIESRIKPTQTWQREILKNPTDFVWSDMEFASFLGLASALSFLPEMLSIKEPGVTTAVAATVVLGQLILGPLFVAPIAYEIKDRNLWRSFSQAIRDKNYTDATAQMREILGTVVQGTGSGLLTLGEGILYMMPYLALKPMMALYTWGKYRLREKIENRTTSWGKAPPGKVADAIVSMLGAAFGFQLWQTMGFSAFTAIGGSTIALPLMLWPVIKYWWVNRPISESSEK